jgi:hypothetical protein
VALACSGYRKGQAQPLAAALATATTVLCHLMLMLLTGAVAVACIFFGDRPPPESENQASSKHGHRWKKNLSVPILQVQTQLAHGSCGIRTFDVLSRWQVLCLPNPARVLVADESVNTVPSNPEEADDHQAESEESHRVQTHAERKGSLTPHQ